jgi:hypothetical protein
MAESPYLPHDLTITQPSHHLTSLHTSHHLTSPLLTSSHTSHHITSSHIISHITSHIASSLTSSHIMSQRLYEKAVAVFCQTKVANWPYPHTYPSHRTESHFNVSLLLNVPVSLPQSRTGCVVGYVKGLVGDSSHTRVRTVLLWAWRPLTCSFIENFDKSTTAARSTVKQQIVVVYQWR